MVGFWIEIIVFIQNYWWLRSPDTDSTYVAWVVGSVGYIDYFSIVYEYSYGRNLIT